MHVVGTLHKMIGAASYQHGNAKFLFYIAEKQSANKTVDVVTWAITFLVYILAVFTFPLSCFCCVKVHNFCMTENMQCAQ